MQYYSTYFSNLETFFRRNILAINFCSGVNKIALQRRILMLNCTFILDLEKGLLPEQSTPDQEEVQTFASQHNDIESGTDRKGVENLKNF